MPIRHFLDGLDPDLQRSLRQQLRTLWAHTSTALEGNSLTLGETHQILTEGLTISGKPLKDHNEVVGHARAEDLMEDLVQKKIDITFEHLFDLHKAIQTSVMVDVYQPIGQWKREPNSTVVMIGDSQVVNDTYARPGDVACLMKEWIKELNSRRGEESAEAPHYAWLHAAFVRIHPFADGNGRMARLLVNFPVLAGGHPPIIISKEKRPIYIQLLAQWQTRIGPPRLDQPLVVLNKEYREFEKFCLQAFEPSQALVDEARQLQKKRDRLP